METFIAAMFPSPEEAFAGHARLVELAHQGSVRIERAAVYGRDARGKLIRADEETAGVALFDPSMLPGGAGGEVLAELREALPPGACALVAHLFETDQSIVDRAMVACGGTVYRRPMADLESEGYVRMMSNDD